MGEDDEDEMSPLAKKFFTIIVIFGLGFGSSYIVFNDGWKEPPIQAIDYAENMFAQFPNGYGTSALNDYMTVKQLKDLYFTYHFVSRALLKRQIKFMCAGDYSEEPIPFNEKQNFCNDICNVTLQ